MKLLITGAAGRMGQEFVARHGRRYTLRLTDRVSPAGAAASEAEWLTGDISDAEFVEGLMWGVDTVLHLAAVANAQAPWEEILPNNVVGALNVFDASMRAGVKRVVFASSIHAALGNPPQETILEGELPRPCSLYGASKCWGEALCSVYSQRGMSCLAVRIGGFRAAGDLPRLSEEMRRQFVSHDDLCELLRLCIEAPADLMFGIFHGVADNAEKRMDSAETQKALGWRPRDAAT